MKNLIQKILRPLHQLLATANDETLIPTANAEDGQVFRLAEDGTLFVPFGDHRHKKGLQRFDRESAEEIHASANSLPGRLLGIPIYAGHPDVKGREDTNPAAPAYGWLDLDGIEIENDGVRFRPKWNKRGREAVENAEFRFYSPHWLNRKVGNVLRPVRLLSFGLTNRPNIPVPALANDEPGGDGQSTTTENDMTKKQLEKLGLAEDATPEQIATRLDALVKSENDLAEAQNKLTTAENDLTEREAALATANDRATAARKALVGSAIDRAVQAGRMPEADRAARETELLAIENDEDLGKALADLDKAETKLKTESKTGDLAGAREAIAAENDAAARSAKRQKLVQEELTSIANDLPAGERYNLAWQRVQHAHPELFAAQAGA